MRVRRIVCCTIWMLFAAEIAAARQVRYPAQVGPFQVAQIAARELARWRYEIITSDAQAGLVVGRRTGTMEDVQDTVNCAMVGKDKAVVHTMTVTASPVPFGAFVEIVSVVLIPGETSPRTDTVRHCEARPIHDALHNRITSARMPEPPQAVASPPIAVSAQQDEGNEDVLELLNAGVRESTVLLFIRNHRGVFRGGPKEIIALTEAGASDAVIDAMMARPAPQITTAAPQPAAERTAGPAPSPTGRASVLVGLAEAQVVELIGTGPSLTQRNAWYYDTPNGTLQVTFGQAEGRRVVTAVSPVDFDLDTIPIRRRR